MINQLVLLFATLGPIGRKLPAPGTMGSLTGTFLVAYFTLGLGWSIQMIALAFIPLFLLGIPLCTRAETLLGYDDPGEVIWDEFVVIPIVFLPLSPILERPIALETFIWITVGFLLFRFFDVKKPWVIQSAQKLPNGLGIMMDDLLAAGASSMVLWAAQTFSLSFFPSMI